MSARFAAPWPEPVYRNDVERQRERERDSQPASQTDRQPASQPAQLVIQTLLLAQKGTPQTPANKQQAHLLKMPKSTSWFLTSHFLSSPSLSVFLSVWLAGYLSGWLALPLTFDAGVAFPTSERLWVPPVSKDRIKAKDLDGKKGEVLEGWFRRILEEDPQTEAPGPDVAQSQLKDF